LLLRSFFCGIIFGKAYEEQFMKADIVKTGQLLTAKLSYGYSLTTIADRIIVGCALSLLVWSYMYYWTSEKTTGDYALILVQNQIPKRVNLQHAQQIHILGSLGESIIEVADDGRIRFIASPCRSKYCIHIGWLSTTDDFAACLPNQVSIELHQEEAIEFDAIAY
jgi:hypothetical protein